MNLKIKKHISILLAGMLLFVTMPLHSYAGDELRIEYLTKEESKRYDNWLKRADKIGTVCLVYCENNEYLIDDNGKIISDKYQVVYDFSEGLAPVRKDGKYGYIDKSGNEVIACKYDSAGDFSEGLALVEKDDKWGYIDKSGNEVIACKYDETWGFSEGLALVRKDGKYGYIDKSENEVIACKYDSAWGFSEGLAPVEKDDKWGYIDKSGNEVTACKYDDAGDFSEGLAPVEKDGKSGFVDKSGNEVIPCKYDYIGEGMGFSEGLVLVEKDDKWGFIDKSGNEAIAFKSEDYWSTHALIKHHGRWGFVEKEYLVSPATQKIIEKGIQRDKMMKVAVPAGAFVAIILIPGMLVLYLKKKKRKVALSENSAYVNATEFSNEGVYAGEVQAMDMAGYCTNCGKPYSNSTQFCGGCGQKLQKRQEE